MLRTSSVEHICIGLQGQLSGNTGVPKVEQAPPIMDGLLTKNPLPIPVKSGAHDTKCTKLVCKIPIPIYLYKVRSHAGIAGNECADAIAKLQPIQGDDTPADTTFPCVNLEGNPIHDTTWLAFEEAAHTHASEAERPNSVALKFKHFSNLHDALRTHMHSKHRLGKTNTEAVYYSITKVYFQQSIQRLAMPSEPCQNFLSK
eukprot:1155738-Pelagomonas_calceolata.AAC.1